MKTLRLDVPCIFFPKRHSADNGNREAKLNTIRFYGSLLPALALCLGTLPATASILYTDLGAGNDYDNMTFWNVCGSGGCGTTTIASQFSVAGSGSETVNQIDLAVGNILSPATFYAAIFTNDAGSPGTQVANAFWNLSTGTSVGDPCCGLVSKAGISGVTLTGGQQYFMVLGPASNSDDSWNGWFYNSQSANGLVLSSDDGGVTWSDANGVSSNPLAAFDVVGTAAGTPEPGSLLLLGTGLIGLGWLLTKTH